MRADASLAKYVAALRRELRRELRRVVLDAAIVSDTLKPLLSAYKSVSYFAPFNNQVIRAAMLRVFAPNVGNPHGVCG